MVSGAKFSQRQKKELGKHFLEVVMGIKDEFDYCKQGRIHYTKSRKARVKYYLETDSEGNYYKKTKRDEVWSDINSIGRSGKEKIGYGTQKPEALVKRIIECFTRQVDIILDCFGGGGSTAAVAEILGSILINDEEKSKLDKLYGKYNKAA